MKISNKNYNPLTLFPIEPKDLELLLKRNWLKKTITIVYRQMSLRFHPDTGPEETYKKYGIRIEDMFSTLTNAYQLVINANNDQLSTWVEEYYSGLHGVKEEDLEEVLEEAEELIDKYVVENKKLVGRLRQTEQLHREEISALHQTHQRQLEQVRGSTSERNKLQGERDKLQNKLAQISNYVGNIYGRCDHVYDISRILNN